MIEYYIIIFILFFAGIFNVDKRCTSIYNTFLFLILFIILSLFAGLRTMGHDFETYKQYFNMIPSYWCDFERTDFSMELGYESLNRIIKLTTSNFNIFLLTFTAISIGCSMILYLKWSPYPILSLSIFCSYVFFEMIMGQIRQPLAITLTYIFVLPLLLKHRILFAVIITILMGILFHKSILFIIPIIIVATIKFSKLNIIVLSIFSVVCYFSTSLLLNTILKFIPYGFYYTDVAIAYLTYNSHSLLFSLGMIERIFICSIVFYYAYYKYNFYNNNLLVRILVNMYFGGCLYYFAFIGLSTEFAARGTHFFNFAIFLLFPILLKLVRYRDKWVLFCIICGLISYHFCSFILAPSIYNPYNTILAYE